MGPELALALALGGTGAQMIGARQQQKKQRAILNRAMEDTAKTQQQAMQMSFFFLLPSLLLSGFMFPFEGMPAFAQAIGQAIPLTHFLRIIRGIVLRGATLADLLPELAWLGGITLALVLASALRFQKKLG